MIDLSDGKIPASETGTLDKIVHSEIMRFVPTFILLSVIFVLGSIGNGLVFYIYQTRYHISNTRLFILYLSALDFLTCIIIVPVHTLTIPNQYRLYIPVLCKASGFFDSLATVSTSLILISIAYERYKKVCKPISRQISLRKVRLLCLLSILVGALIAVQNVFIYGKGTAVLKYYNLPLIECSVDDGMKNTALPFVGALVYILVFLTTLISVTVMYSCAVIAIYKQASKMYSPNSSRIQRQDGCQSSISSHGTKSSAGSSSSIFIKRIWTTDIVRDVSVPYQYKVKFGKKPCVNQSAVIDTESTVINDTDYSTVERSANRSKSSTLELKKLNLDNETNLDPEVKSNASMSHEEDTANLATKHRAQRKSSPISGQTRHPLQTACRRSIIMMLSVTLTFIVCYIPVIAILAIRGLDKDFVNNLSNTEYILYKLFLRSYFINFAANPFIYGICDSKFRKIVKRMFSKCFAKFTPQVQHS